MQNDKRISVYDVVADNFVPNSVWVTFEFDSGGDDEIAVIRDVNGGIMKVSLVGDIVEILDVKISGGEKNASEKEPGYDNSENS